MIRAFLFLVLVFAAGASLILYLQPDTGYVLINFHHYVMETSFVALLVGMGLCFVAAYLLLRLLSLAVRLPGSLRERIDRRRNDRARGSFETGLQNLFEGNWKRAEVELVRRAADHHVPHLNYIAAARAAQHQGASDRRDHYLELAAQAKPELEFTTLLARADLQRKRAEFPATRQTALLLRERDPEHPYAIELLAESYAALGEWEALRKLLGDSAGLPALPPARRDELTKLALIHLLRSATAEARLDKLKALWEASSPVQTDEAVRRAYVQGLARLNADIEAAALIMQTLARVWDGELVLLYGDVHVVDLIGQLATVEQWLTQYGERPELLQTAGRVCLKNKLWGKARSYLEAVLTRAPTPKAYLDLARLSQETQQPEDAAKFNRLGLELATQA